MPPGRIWLGAAFAPPRAFVVPRVPASDSRLALGPRIVGVMPWNG